MFLTDRREWNWRWRRPVLPPIETEYQIRKSSGNHTSARIRFEESWLKTEEGEITDTDYTVTASSFSERGVSLLACGSSLLVLAEGFRLKRKPMALIKKLRKAVRRCLRNMIIVPEMIGSVVGVDNGKTFNQIEIKPEMIGNYLAEFSISYKPIDTSRQPILQRDTGLGNIFQLAELYFDGFFIRVQIKLKKGSLKLDVFIDD
ncbi:hypothetical protein L2E82_01986 [Cichorium intybus]|uniref:Uncharacterized protein n=1 Tax=Cichorium intybus TaxID=13427 RepID=A0ACB9H1K7_CICIN|nr:hypothetical protein L2E82_01986 [Cichorium intybus]